MLRLKYFIWLTCLFSLWFYMPGLAQEKPEARQFFIYIQNESGAPFYVKNGSSLMSSSPEGYIIIPRLQKGKYTFTIGFPKHEMPEASFDIHLDGSGDKGFLIRKENKGFQLLGLRNFDVVKPLAVASAPGNRIVNLPATSMQPGEKKQNKVTTAGENEDKGRPQVAVTQKNTNAENADDSSDAFSRMLNEITGKSKSSTAAPPGEKQSENPDSQKTAVATLPPGRTNIPAEETNINQEENKLPAGNNLIPSEKPAHQKRTARRQESEPQFITFSTDSSQISTMPQENSQTDNHGDTENNNEIKENARPQKTAPDTVQQALIVNSDCQHLANKDEFQKVRRKMASRSSDESMYEVAKKYFSGGTCYSTAQVRSLIYLFMTDEYKYKFLELTYAHVYDTSHFPSLVNTLESNYYQVRFKAMVK